MDSNTFSGCETPNTKNHTQTAITQQYLIKSQTKHQNLPQNILFTLIRSRKSHLFLTFNFRPLWCPYMGQENFSEPQALSTTNTFHIYHNKILKLYVILLCGLQHICVHVIKKSNFDFQPTKKPAMKVTTATIHHI